MKFCYECGARCEVINIDTPGSTSYTNRLDTSGNFISEVKSGSKVCTECGRYTVYRGGLCTQCWGESHD